MFKTIIKQAKQNGEVMDWVIALVFVGLIFSIPVYVAVRVILDIFGS